MACGDGMQYITKLTRSFMPPLCKEGGYVTGNGNVLSWTMCLKCRAISNTDPKKKLALLDTMSGA